MTKEPDFINGFIKLLISDSLNPSCIAAVADAKIKVAFNITSNWQKQTNPTRRKAYVTLQLHQLVRTADTLYCELSYQSHYPLKRALVIQLKLINEINGLLKECDPKVMLSQVELDKARRKYLPQLHSLLAKLESHCFDPDLIRLSAKPLREFLISNRRRRFSKQKFCYLQKYIKGLNSSELNTSGDESISDLLLDKLISLNYNEMELYRYCGRYLLKKVAVQTDLSEKEKILKAYLVRWSTLAGSSSCYDPQWESLQTNLVDWLQVNLRRLKLN